jgi:signal transduction histidine kinase
MLARQFEKKGESSFSTERIQKFVEQTLRQVNRLSRLVDDMLDISRIQTKKLALIPEQVNLCELVQDVVDRLSDQFVSVGGEPPSLILCEQAVGNWDRMRIEQVVINLLTNALRYGRGKRVEVRIQVEGGSAHLFVKDQGIGISKEAQTKIFDRFERAVSSNEVSGLGLGLYISRQIVEAHGGTIRVESELGQGATFEVVLPLSAIHTGY